MPISRIFQAKSLPTNSIIELDTAASHHVARVLRAKVKDELIIFNGEGGEHNGKIIQIDKNSVKVELTNYISRDSESSLEIFLAQGISRGEKMDYTIQKAVELGVKKIIPLLTERCNVKLNEDRREKRLLHWGSIIVGACEQSGRNFIPEIMVPQTFKHFLDHSTISQKLIMHPEAEKKLSQIPLQKNSPVILIVGPEGGFSDTEITMAQNQGCVPLLLGPRILRTETAALAAITALQVYAGDFS